MTKIYIFLVAITGLLISNLPEAFAHWPSQEWCEDRDISQEDCKSKEVRCQYTTLKYMENRRDKDAQKLMKKVCGK